MYPYPNMSDADLYKELYNKEIALWVYAHVSTQFAIYSALKNRGPNFNWVRFKNNMMSSVLNEAKVKFWMLNSYKDSMPFTKEEILKKILVYSEEVLESMLRWV